MQKLRVSFSILSLWRSGRVEDLVNSYFKLKEVKNPYMDEGKAWDKKMNECVLKTSSLLPEFGAEKLISPQVQKKWEVLFENYILVGIPDILDLPILYEVKTGASKDSSDYATDFQIAMYFFMAHLQGIDIQKGVILHYNQYTKELDKSLIWNTDYERERARNYILTLSPEILDYFETNDLWNKYGKLPIDKKSTDMVV